MSPVTTVTASGATPRRSAQICARVVSWLWPCGAALVSTITRPLGSTRTVAPSNGPRPVDST